MGRGARADDDKARKHQMILDAALTLFRRERHMATVAAIAAEAGIAKGTLYLYFKTKEEIYMELLVQNFARWHERLRNFILDARPERAAMVDYLSSSLGEITDFVALFSVSATVLEENLAVDYVGQARRRLRLESMRSSQLIATTYPDWDETRCLRALLRFYTYGFAAWRDSFPAPSVRAALPEEFADHATQLKRYLDEMRVVTRLFWT